MARPLKPLLLGLLAPPAWLVQRLAEPTIRLWSHARLASKIRHPLDPSVVVLGVPEVRGSGEILPGQELFLYRELYLETQGEGYIRLGDGVVLSRGVHLVAFAGVEIGAGTMIGEYSGLRDADHDYRSGGSLRAAGHRARPIRIGQEVWLGRGVTVLAGVSIGDRAVVGAGAVVTRDVAPGAVVAGVPARALRAGS